MITWHNEARSFHMKFFCWQRSWCVKRSNAWWCKLKCELTYLCFLFPSKFCLLRLNLPDLHSQNWHLSLLCKKCRADVRNEILLRKRMGFSYVERKLDCSSPTHLAQTVQFSRASSTRWIRVSPVQNHRCIECIGHVKKMKWPVKVCEHALNLNRRS